MSSAADYICGNTATPASHLPRPVSQANNTIIARNAACAETKTAKQDLPPFRFPRVLAQAKGKCSEQHALIFFASDEQALLHAAKQESRNMNKLQQLHVSNMPGACGSTPGPA